jgi:hypothetical protein
VEAVPYAEDAAARWDALVAAAPMGTFLHTRRFLSYHGARFRDCSLLFNDASGHLVGALPAAADPADARCAVSHPGATYGGLLYGARNAADHAAQLLQATVSALRAQGFARLRYKTVPAHLQRDATQADAYALWRAGARLVARELWNVIDLSRERDAGASRRQEVRHARERGVTVGEDNSSGAYAEFMAMLGERLEEKHAVKPVHTLDELLLLRERFPECISLWLARDAQSAPLAGAWIFDIGTHASHGQYGATNAGGRRDFALSLLLDQVMESAAQRGRRWFSFGASTHDGGRSLNSGLYNFKASFGPGCVVHDVYELDLN